MITNLKKAIIRYNKEIKNLNNIKILGSTLNSKLNWNDTFQNGQDGLITNIKRKVALVKANTQLFKGTKSTLFYRHLKTQQKPNKI